MLYLRDGPFQRQLGAAADDAGAAEAESEKEEDNEDEDDDEDDNGHNSKNSPRLQRTDTVVVADEGESKATSDEKEQVSSHDLLKKSSSRDDFEIALDEMDEDDDFGDDKDDAGENQPTTTATVTTTSTSTTSTTAPPPAKSASTLGSCYTNPSANKKLDSLTSAGNPNFMTQFYEKSRLHFLSTWGLFVLSLSLSLLLFFFFWLTVAQNFHFSPPSISAIEMKNVSRELQLATGKGPPLSSGIDLKRVIVHIGESLFFGFFLSWFLLANTSKHFRSGRILCVGQPALASRPCGPETARRCGPFHSDGR